METHPHNRHTSPRAAVVSQLIQIPRPFVTPMMMKIWTGAAIPSPLVVVAAGGKPSSGVCLISCSGVWMAGTRSASGVSGPLRWGWSPLWRNSIQTAVWSSSTFNMSSFSWAASLASVVLARLWTGAVSAGWGEETDCNGGGRWNVERALSHCHFNSILKGNDTKLTQLSLQHRI